MRRASQTTSDLDRACSEAPADSSGLLRRLRFFGKRSNIHPCNIRAKAKRCPSNNDHSFR
jgi:hypothetical protein